MLLQLKNSHFQPVDKLKIYDSTYHHEMNNEKEKILGIEK